MYRKSVSSFHFRQSLSCIRALGLLSVRRHGRHLIPFGLAMVVLLSCVNTALAGVVITRVGFKGSNSDLTMTIFGNGFGSAPPGIPCRSCATSHIAIGGGIGCSSVYNISAWTNTFIVLGGIQGNPGNNVLIKIENPHNQAIGVATATIPSSIALVSPKIRSVAIGGTGKNLQLTISGSGFGPAPPGVPGEASVPFFSFVDEPFSSAAWQAGYQGCGQADFVLLNFVSWSNTKIRISGFSNEYGKGSPANHHYTVAPGDTVAIAVGNSLTQFGLEFGHDYYSPAGAGALWGGTLP
jgi:hypothetical protein